MTAPPEGDLPGEDGSQPLSEVEAIAEYEEIAHDDSPGGSVFDQHNPFPDIQAGESTPSDPSLSSN